jgi:hypothetical protein
MMKADADGISGWEDIFNEIEDEDLKKATKA